MQMASKTRQQLQRNNQMQHRDYLKLAGRYDVLQVERDALREALKEALDGWAYAASYKGDYFREKHGDDEDIARLRALLVRGEEP